MGVGKGIGIEYRFLVLLFATLLTYRRWKSWRSKRPGLCLSCSYALRAHHPGDKCPECGSVMEAGKEV